MASEELVELHSYARLGRRSRPLSRPYNSPWGKYVAPIRLKTIQSHINYVPYLFTLTSVNLLHPTNRRVLNNLINVGDVGAVSCSVTF